MITFLSEFLSLPRKGKNVLNEFTNISTNVFGQEVLINKKSMHQINISMFTLGEKEKYFMTMVK